MPNTYASDFLSTIVTIFDASANGKSVLLVTWARRLGGIFDFSLFHNPTFHLSENVGFSFKIYVKSDHFSSHATTLCEQSSHLVFPLSTC